MAKKYVGITSRSVHQRWQNGNGYKPAKGKFLSFYAAMQKYGWDNFKHEILFEKLTEQEAKEKEIALIKLYDCFAPNGYNLTKGGDGALGYVPNDNLCKRRSELFSGGNNPTAQKVVYGDKIFNTITDRAVYLGVNRNKIVRWITGQTIIPKIHLENGLRFLNEEPNYKTEKKKCTIVRTRGLYQGIIYPTVKSCAKIIGVDHRTLDCWLNGYYGIGEKYQFLLGTDLSFVDKETKLRTAIKPGPKKEL